MDLVPTPTPPAPPAATTQAAAAPSNLYLMNGGKMVVSLRPDGTVVFGDGVLLDEASLLFWKSVEKNFPKFCEQLWAEQKAEVKK
jgi:hypothetical protein